MAGGFVLDDLDTHDALCRALAPGSGCAVAAVDYSLSPETRFPGAIEDVHAALTSLQPKAPRWAWTPNASRWLGTAQEVRSRCGRR
jgi:acetyl esterase/lipase